MNRFERKEYKYRVPLKNLDQLRERISSYMELDGFCSDCNNNQYSVRSIYLDTPGNLFYFEKIDGLKVRKKLRIRAYNDIDEKDIVFLEIKRKIGDTIFKERTKVKYSDSFLLLNGARIKPVDKDDPTAQTTLNRFIYLTKRLKLEPNSLITYEREAYKGIGDDNLRVTLDLSIRSYPKPKLSEICMFEEMKIFADDFFIMEVKFNGKMPQWVKRAVQDFGLRLQPFSKYCNGVDAWTPSAASE